MRAHAAPGTDVVASPRTLLAVAGGVVAAIAAAFAAFAAVHGRPAFADAAAQPGGWPGALAGFVAVAALREALHAAVWRAAAHVPWRALTVRRSRRKLGVVVEPSVPISAAADRAGLLVPAFALGVPPLVLGIALGRGLALLWGGALLVEGWSDLAIAAASSRLPASALVLPHPSRLGRRVAGTADHRAAEIAQGPVT